MPSNAPRVPAVLCATERATSWRSRFRRRGFNHAFVAIKDPASRRWIRIETIPGEGIMTTSPGSWDRFETAPALAGFLNTLAGHQAIAVAADRVPRVRWWYWFKSSGVGLICYLLGVRKMRSPLALYRRLNSALAKEDAAVAKAKGRPVPTAAPAPGAGRRLGRI